MELSAQTNRLVVTSGKTVSFIPALPNGNQTLSLTLNYAPSSASIHPISQDRFVTGSTSDEWVRVHSLDGTEREVLKGHHGPVHCVEYSPDGEMFASGSGTCIFPTYGDDRSLITYVFYSSITSNIEDGTTFQLHLQSSAAANDDSLPPGTIRLWQTNPGTSYGLWQGPQTNGG